LRKYWWDHYDIHYFDGKKLLLHYTKDPLSKDNGDSEWRDFPYLDSSNVLKEMFKEKKKNHA